MRYRNIPGTELEASVISLGTVPLGSGLGEEESFRLLDAYLDLGGNFIDTANVYGDWVPGIEKSASEKTIGRWMKRRGVRGRVILGTKGAHPDLATMNVPRLAPQDIVHDIDQSLRHLQTDYIDLYWLHRDDPAQPAGSIMEVLNDQIARGKIRAIGCSNWTVPRIAEAQAYAAEHGLTGFAGNQMMWSLAVPNKDKPEDSTMVHMDDDGKAYHRDTGLTAIPYSSQAYGFFSGRYSRDRMPEKKSVADVFYNEENFRRLDRVARVAREAGRTNTDVILAYLMAHPFPVFPIIGSRTTEQLRESCAAGSFELDPAAAKFIETGE